MSWLRDASEETAATWRRRRAAQLLGPSALAIITFIAAGADQSALLITCLAVLGGILAVLGITAISRYGNGARVNPQALAAPIGQFPLNQLVAEPIFATQLQGVNARFLRTWARGWAVGRVNLLSDRLLLIPGRVARGAGVPELELPWISVQHVEVLPVLGVALGLEFAISGSPSLSCQVIGRRFVRKALRLVERNLSQGTDEGE